MVSGENLNKLIQVTHNKGSFDMLTHFSCFSGIGGIDLAAEWAGFQTVGQVEFADYPYRVLCKHWPDVPKWRDIKDVNGTEIRSVCGDVTILSGGFPCQPHSFAGKRKGSSDERNLWPELRRIIGELKPRWFLGENVPGLLSSDSGRFFSGILRELAEMGYNVGWCSYEAARVGAPHRRERVFIVAYSNSSGLLHGQTEEHSAKAREHALGELKPGCENVAYSDSNNVQREFSGISHQEGRKEQIKRPFGSCSDGFRWWSVEPGLGRVAHGIPSRVDRLKCLGNAVVPQQVYPILQEIANIELS